MWDDVTEKTAKNLMLCLQSSAETAYTTVEADLKRIGSCFLTQHQGKPRLNTHKDRILATGKHVVIIGGGDTGSDCVGTSIRQGAKSITQIEILPKPPGKRAPNNPWPFWGNVLRSSSSHDEGCERFWSLSTKRCLGENGYVKGIEVVEADWISTNGSNTLVEKPDPRH
jgi:glutamate synthase (NADPH/NADH) small chain